MATYYKCDACGFLMNEETKSPAELRLVAEPDINCYKTKVFRLCYRCWQGLFESEGLRDWIKTTARGQPNVVK